MIAGPAAGGSDRTGATDRSGATARSGAPAPAGPTDPAGAADTVKPAALAFEGVSASYGPYRALFAVSFSVPAGGVVALLGSNGSGKSTTARVATGLLATTGGRVFVGGDDVTNKTAHHIARLGVAHVPEGRGVFGRLTVEENLVLGFRQRVGKAKVTESLERAFEAFPVLGDRRTQRAGTLSGGQQRLLSLAKVLVAPPRLLVADELSLGLAPIVIEAVYEGLRQIHGAGTAVLVVEQQVSRALELASVALILDHGTVAFDGPSGEATAVAEEMMHARTAHDASPNDGTDTEGGEFARVEREWRWSARRRKSGRAPVPGAPPTPTVPSPAVPSPTEGAPGS